MNSDFFVPNTADELHCYQACYMMTVQRLTDASIGIGEAERDTGFRTGHRSWAFRGLLGLVNRGLEVETIDDFDPEEFADDPERTVSSWYANDPKERERIIRESELDKEGDAVKALLASPEMKFTRRAPDWADLTRLSEENEAVLLARVNHRVLMGRDGSYGHYVLVEHVDSSAGIRVQDPGPPARPDYVYDVDTFRRAWWYPDEHSGELIAVRRPREDS